MELDLPLTAIAACVCALAARACGRDIGAKAPDPQDAGRMLPWCFMMLVLALLTLLLVVHLLTLLGLSTTSRCGFDNAPQPGAARGELTIFSQEFFQNE